MEDGYRKYVCLIKFQKHQKREKKEIITEKIEDNFPAWEKGLSSQMKRIY